MASIRELSSGRFNVQLRKKGCKPVSKTFDSYKEAEEWASNFTAYKKQEPIRPNEKEDILTFTALGYRYCHSVLKGRPSFFVTLKRIEKIGDRLPEDVRKITKFDVNDYKLKRLETIAPVTCRDELQLIHRVFRWAHRELILDRAKYPSPCDEIQMPPTSKPRNRVVEPEELQRLLTALSPTMRVIVELAYETAMRRGEIVKLKAKNIYLEERILLVVDGKTGDRSVPLTRRACELLGESLKGCEGPESRLYPVEPHSVSTALRRARKQVGLDDDVRLHQLRHTRITQVARKGFNQAQIMMVSGHRDVRSVQRYTHLNVGDVIDLLD